MSTLPSLFLENETIDAEIEVFCANDPKYINLKQQFDDAADKIARQVGFEQYDAFERCLWDYFCRTADLYYLYGLGLRQDILRAIGG